MKGKQEFGFSKETNSQVGAFDRQTTDSSEFSFVNFNGCCERADPKIIKVPLQRNNQIDSQSMYLVYLANINSSPLP